MVEEVHEAEVEGGTRDHAGSGRLQSAQLTGALKCTTRAGERESSRLPGRTSRSHGSQQQGFHRLPWD